MIIQSHRGAGNLAPENTLESFELAWELGTIPEADVRATKDGVIVAFHDDTIERLVKDPPAEWKSKSICDLTWEHVKNFDVGSYKGAEFAGQKIPAIEAVFEKMYAHPELMLYLDVKEISLEQMADMTKHYGVTSQVILASTIYEELRRWKELLPDSGTLIWLGHPEERQRKRFAELREMSFAGLTQLQLHVRITDPAAQDPFDPSSEFIRQAGEELKPRGILFQTLPWHAHSEKVEVYKRLMQLGVESFATDEPKVTLEAVEQ